MDIIEWSNKINTIKINDTIKTNIITFFKNFQSKHSLLIIEITDNEMINAFNNVNNYKPITICLDIEFQSTIISKKDKHKYINNLNSNDEPSSKFIRELGMLFFIKDLDTKWYYIGSIFINFNSLDKYGFELRDLRLIGSKYATVTQKTYHEMLKNETSLNVEDLITPLYSETLFRNHKQYIIKVNNTVNQLKSNHLFKKLLKDKIKDRIVNILNNIIIMDNFSDVQRELKYVKKQLHNIQYELYGKYLDKLLLKNLLDTHKLYWNDSLVKERINLINKKEHIFFEYFQNLVMDSVLVVKGQMDIVAIKNMSQLIVNEDFQIDNYYDIETFNGFSQTMYKSAQLEETYNGMIKTKIYNQKAKQFFDQISSNIGDKAHNPLVDSLFTIIIAIIMNLGINKYFKDIDRKNIGGNHYHKYYIKLKNEYLSLKNKN